MWRSTASGDLTRVSETLGSMNNYFIAIIPKSPLHRICSTYLDLIYGINGYVKKLLEFERNTWSQITVFYQIILIVI